MVEHVESHPLTQHHPPSFFQFLFCTCRCMVETGSFMAQMLYCTPFRVSWITDVSQTSYVTYTFQLVSDWSACTSAKMSWRWSSSSPFSTQKHELRIENLLLPKYEFNRQRSWSHVLPCLSNSAEFIALGQSQPWTCYTERPVREQHAVWYSTKRCCYLGEIFFIGMFRYCARLSYLHPGKWNKKHRRRWPCVCWMQKSRLLPSRTCQCAMVVDCPHGMSLQQHQLIKRVEAVGAMVFGAD